jgi:hypothetical protein
MAKARIEETGIMNAELADQRIERRHLGGVERRHMHRLAAHQNVEFIGIEDQVGEPRLYNGSQKSKTSWAARLSTSITAVWCLPR